MKMALAIALLLCSCVAHEGAIEIKKDPFLGDTRTFSLSLDGGNWNAIDVTEAKGATRSRSGSVAQARH
jgi:hypothetical protein